ncbi:MAG: DUF5106 domain-containing protein, partial [Muribaculaceae bacterium]|nr:DUF5106 domain-containing protein [Muribaculaceae bacterium]
MKKLIYSIFTAVALIFSIGTKASAQTDNTLFTYPQAPDELTTLYQRCNYLVDHFWDRCNYSTAFLNKKKLNDAFGHWIGFMPYATADTV